VEITLSDPKFVEYGYPTELRLVILESNIVIKYWCKKIQSDVRLGAVYFRWSPADNCGMVEIRGICASQGVELILMEAMELWCRRRNKSVIIGNDRIDGASWNFIEKWGTNWNFQVCTWNRNYDAEISGIPHKIGFFWKNIGEYDYQQKYGLGPFVGVDPSNGRRRSGNVSGGSERIREVSDRDIRRNEGTAEAFIAWDTTTTS